MNVHLLFLFALRYCSATNKTIFANGLHPAPFVPQTCADTVFCVHRCVFMRVSSWWRAVSVRGVYAGGKCDLSLARAVTQVPEHSLAESSHITFLLFMMGSSGKGPSNYLPLKNTPLTLHTHRNIFEENIHSQGLDIVCNCNSSDRNQNSLLIKQSTLEIE